MKMTLTRDVKTPSFTLGQLQCGKWNFFTCEDAIREVKIPGQTCIPFGTYKVVITFSNRFQKSLPLLLDVPNFEGVRIHAGNTAEDTEGCILVGCLRSKEGVANSRLAAGMITDAIEKEIALGNEVWLEIV